VTTYAELDDLIPRFPRDLTDAEEEAAPTLLDDASFWLGVWVPGLDNAIQGGDEVLAQAAKLLVVAMVKRSLLSQVPDNPGVQSLTETAGPYSQAVTYRNPEGEPVPVRERVGVHHRTVVAEQGAGSVHAVPGTVMQARLPSPMSPTGVHGQRRLPHGRLVRDAVDGPRTAGIRCRRNCPRRESTTAVSSPRKCCWLLTRRCIRRVIVSCFPVKTTSRIGRTSCRRTCGTTPPARLGMTRAAKWSSRR
jgi:hypothetical protein